MQVSTAYPAHQGHNAQSRPTLQEVQGGQDLHESVRLGDVSERYAHVFGVDDAESAMKRVARVQEERGRAR